MQTIRFLYRRSANEFLIRSALLGKRSDFRTWDQKILSSDTESRGSVVNPSAIVPKSGLHLPISEKTRTMEEGTRIKNDKSREYAECK